MFRFYLSCGTSGVESSVVRQLHSVVLGSRTIINVRPRLVKPCSPWLTMLPGHAYSNGQYPDYTYLTVTRNSKCHSLKPLFLRQLSSNNTDSLRPSPPPFPWQMRQRVFLWDAFIIQINMWNTAPNIYPCVPPMIYGSFHCQIEPKQESESHRRRSSFH